MHKEDVFNVSSCQEELAALCCSRCNRLAATPSIFSPPNPMEALSSADANSPSSTTFVLVPQPSSSSSSLHVASYFCCCESHQHRPMSRNGYVSKWPGALACSIRAWSLLSSDPKPPANRKVDISSYLSNSNAPESWASTDVAVLPVRHKGANL